MIKPTRQQIEAISNLLQACKLCGASFATGLKTTITMPDGRIYKVEDLKQSWRLSHLGFRITLKKVENAENLKDQILASHVTITKEKACPSFQRW